MKTVISTIEHLLFTHQMVVIPTFGAFVRQHRDAYFFAESLIPPKETVVFNPDLTDNDGLLATTLMRSNSLTWAEANNEISRFVLDLKQRLEHKRPVAIGRLGSMVLSHNRLLFLPSDMAFLPQNIGMQTLQPQKRFTGTVTISIRRDILHYAAACFAGLCLLAIPLKTNDNRQKATLLHTPVLVKKNNPQKAEVTKSSTDNKKQAEVQPIVVEEQPTTTPETLQMPQPSDNGRFHIVVASIAPDRAEAMLEQLHNQGYIHAKAMDNNGLKRIVISSYSTFADARTAMYQTRTNTPYDKAWILQDK